MKNKMTSADWTDEVATRLVKKLSMWFEILGDRNEAIAKTKAESTAGPLSWKAALDRLCWAETAA